MKRCTTANTAAQTIAFVCVRVCEVTHLIYVRSKSDGSNGMLR